MPRLLVCHPTRVPFGITLAGSTPSLQNAQTQVAKSKTDVVSISLWSNCLLLPRTARATRGMTLTRMSLSRLCLVTLNLTNVGPAKRACTKGTILSCSRLRSPKVVAAKWGRRGEEIMHCALCVGNGALRVLYTRPDWFFSVGSFDRYCTHA